MSTIKLTFGLPGAASSPATFSIDPVTKAAAGRVERGGHCACLASRTRRGSPGVPKLHAEVQDVSAQGWRKLLELVTNASAENTTIFEPSAGIPGDQWSGVITLPGEIETLSAVKQMRLYGSHLRRLPPQIGCLKALKNLDVYTSYSLHWLPYEVMRCAQLRQTRMSTRALYGNIKTRLPFPRLAGPIEPLMPRTCSVCDRVFDDRGPQLFWTTQRIGTDIAPLLIHSCSPACTALVPDAPEGYHARPHKGGGGVGMPDPEAD